VGDHHHHVTAISQDSREAAIRALAGRQSGNISRAQLLEVGLSEGAIDARLRSGALTRRYPGVYALAPARQDPQALIAAAVLAGGPDAVASHASAAWLWGFVPRYEPPPEITLTQGDRRPRHILTHRCLSLQPRDVTRQRGVPTTSPARTILDLAPRLTTKQRTRLVNDALLSHHLRQAALRDVLDRSPYHPGTKLLRPFTDSNPTNPTRSPFEDDFLAFIAKYTLPTPQINVYVSGREVDAYFPDHNVIVECDGREYHKNQDAFEDDRERDTENLKHGLITVRLTKKRLINHPDYEAERLRDILSGGSS
jgi:hypothetical protein